MEQKFLRLFCAIELPLDVRERAVAQAAQLRAEIAAPLKVSWEGAEKMHITLKFFGDVEPQRAPLLESALSRCAAQTEPFVLHLDKYGVFASANRPNVFWLGVADSSGRLAALQRAIEDECERAGFPRDARPFHPHVTIARVRTITNEARRLARLHTETAFPRATFNADEIVLLQSQLGTRGSTYVALSRHRLKAGDENRVD